MAPERSADLLIELGCEELPPNAVDALREGLFSGVADGLERANITFDRGSSRSFSTPRRLALRLTGVAGKQPDQVIERRGPAVSAAFDATGKPTAAAEGFARSVGVAVGQLERLETDKGEWLYCKQKIAGQTLGELLFEILASVLKQLPIPRPMRWADHDFTFVRPLHWLVVLHGDRVLPGTLLGRPADRKTYGHRIHAPGPHALASSAVYEQTLLDTRVLADPHARRARIVSVLEEADKRVIIDGALLDEVNNLVEWPVAVACRFDEAFLEVPHPALIASMQDHQKFFPVSAGKNGPGDSAISNRFVAVSNIESTDVDQVRRGYERVIRPRLADARFFLEQDQKKPLAEYGPALDDVIFQEKIGTIGDKTRRVSSISEQLASLLGVDIDTCTRAAALSKCDLVTQMVGEFPELQGTMGAHYARASGESEAVAQAIGEHYAPRFAGDQIPGSPAGRIVSLADRADTLVAIFAAGLAPSGNKDPFALRRAALGLVRVLSEAELPLPPATLLAAAADALADTLAVDPGLVAEVETFIMQRARSHFREQGFGAEMVTAVLASPWKHFPDLEARLRALTAFMGREEAESLATANKRIGNILRKSQEELSLEIDAELLRLQEERCLFDEVTALSGQIEPLIHSSEYALALEALATLKVPVDSFFDTVLVMDEDDGLRRNRLALLARLKGLFDDIADLSVLG